MPQFAVVLPAAGKSSRFKLQPRKKPFIELQSRAVWLRAADHFQNRPDVAQTIVVVSPDDLDWFKTEFAHDIAAMRIDVAVGGAERADSVGNALALVKPEIDLIAVHDAARPILASAWIDRVFAAAIRDGAAILATPITSTIKRATAGGKVAETVPRIGLWAAQTPQVFRKQLLIDAYAGRGKMEPTDEAQLIESFGHPVTLVEGSPLNIKITADDDFHFADILVARGLGQPSK